MALQTREQHIRREKATSNICTAQALIANMSAAYAIHHGPEGLKNIAAKIQRLAYIFATGIKDMGYDIVSDDFFGTVDVIVPDDITLDTILFRAWEQKMNLRVNIEKLDNDETIRHVIVSFDETHSLVDIDNLFSGFSSAAYSSLPFSSMIARETDSEIEEHGIYSPLLARKSQFLTQPVFNSYHSEIELMRYLNYLSSKDLSLSTAMIPLGSCTMKLTAAAEMYPISWQSVSGLHPFAPHEQCQGFDHMIRDLEQWLANITGMTATSLQPNAGSAGEYTGLNCITAYHKSNGDSNRNVVLIPKSAHGTNPASAAIAGLKVIVVKCTDNGEVDIMDLKKQADKHKNDLAAMMITYPSTHGVFEDTIKEAIEIVHEAGGLVYMDGANMNAQVGLTSPGELGADVCHLNLHKTFAIPHGGGGPGIGPICVASNLAPFLPTIKPSIIANSPTIRFCDKTVIQECTSPSQAAKTVGQISSAPYGSASALPITWMYLRLLGPEGLRSASEVAILSANYMAAKLSKHFKILYTGENGFVAHEFILDVRPFKNTAGITETDIAKRLMDFNFHAPTMSFPVPGTLMVEPTESESLYELDRFCDAMTTIREEIRDIEEGRADKLDNPLKNSPHTHDMVSSDTWSHKYSREQAAYPQPYLKKCKFWPNTGRVDNVWGDRNLFCRIPTPEEEEAILTKASK